MLSDNLNRRRSAMRILSDDHASAIVLELRNARDAGNSPVPHGELLFLVDCDVPGAVTYYWQQSIRWLSNLGIIELIAHKEHIVLYQLNPQMDSFCAELIKLVFEGEQGSRHKLPPEPKNAKSSADGSPG